MSSKKKLNKCDDVELCTFEFFELDADFLRLELYRYMQNNDVYPSHISRDIGIDRNTVIDFLKNIRIPSYKTLTKIYRFLKKNDAVFLSKKDDNIIKE